MRSATNSGGSSTTGRRWPATRAGAGVPPTIPDLILRRFGVCYNVHSISQLLCNLGFSLQKVRFLSDHRDEAAHWPSTTTACPMILRLARETGAAILFGDVASFPQWGTLSSTWALRG